MTAYQKNQSKRRCYAVCSRKGLWFL